VAFENHLNFLATNNLSQLYFHLNRIDVYEHKLQEMIVQHKSVPIGKILAALIIARIAEKQTAKANHTFTDNPTNEERW
jgi:hypothetical protein